MKERIYSKNPLHVRIPIAIEETLESILENDELRKKQKSYNKSDIIRRALHNYCMDYEQ